MDLLVPLPSLRPFREALRVGQAVTYKRNCSGAQFGSEFGSEVEALERDAKVALPLRIYLTESRCSCLVRARRRILK